MKAMLLPKRFAVVLTLCLIPLREVVADTAVPPSRYGPVPTERQLRWHEMEFCGFVHFTVNTVTVRARE